MMRIAIFLLLVANSVSLADGIPKSLTGSEKKALAKYDHLPDNFKTKAREAWYAEYKRRKKHSLLLKNDPPFYPSLLDNRLKVNEGAWGFIGVKREFGDDPKEKPGLYVLQVLDKHKLLCKHAEVFIVEVDDTSSVVDKKLVTIDGPFYVSGTDTYTTLDGASKTVYVCKPIPKKD